MIPSRTEWQLPTRLIHLEHPAAHCPDQHDKPVGGCHIQSMTPDLFSAPASPAPCTHPPDATSQPRHVLPRGLPSAIKHLDDQELERLIAAALVEQRRRGGKPVAANAASAHKQRVEVVGTPLTTGKLNAVRAAFKAGIKPTQIARQFGLSDTDVRRALASDVKKR